MRIDGLSAIANGFDGFLIDQFGVIHDGRTLYPGTLGALEGLRRLGKPVVVMTNSGKRAAANRQRLVALGVPRDCFVDAISSGEIAYNMLFSPSSSPRRGEGRVRGGAALENLNHLAHGESPSPHPLPAGERKKDDAATGERKPVAFLIGKDGEDYGFDGVSFVADPRDARIILILGSNAPRTSLAQYRDILRGLTIPALCCNPDKFMLTARGLQPAPGAIAALYEEMGGTVTWIGKPYPEIYRAAAAMIGTPRRILCIGDSAEHDVAGGRGAGFATLLVEQGVTAEHPLAPDDPQPDFLMKAFQW